MHLLLADPDCGMCHAGGAVFTALGEVCGRYPPEHSLLAIGSDPVLRALHVVQNYSTLPSLWGVYRRSATDRLAPLRDSPGWDRALLAELALYGTIRHVQEPLYWHREESAPPRDAAPTVTGCSREWLRATDPFTDLRWRIPLIASAFALVETFATSRLGVEDRRALIAEVAPLFRRRWTSRMTEEAIWLRDALPGLIAAADAEEETAGALARSNLAVAVQACAAIVPEIELMPFLSQALTRPPSTIAAAA